MMKRFFTHIAALALVLICTVLLPPAAKAADASDLTFELNSDGLSYYVSDCAESASGELVIPATYNGKAVTGIGYEAFFRCNSLTSITIPDSVTSIGDSAFENCTSLTSINIPDGVTSLGFYTFENCTSLTSVNIPDGVTSIGDYAFRSCTSLTSITIPDGVTRIGERAFSGCTGLTSITIPDSVTNIRSAAFSGCTSLTDVYITDPSAWCKIYFWIYSGIPAIPMYDGDHLHILDKNGEEVTEIVLDDTVTTIPDYAFKGCTSLTSITIPDSVTNIGRSAFSNCTGLTSITIPDGVTSIAYDAFYGCTIEELIIADGSTTVTSAMVVCGSTLKRVIIPNSVTSIGERAFFGCNSLTSITIPDSVTTIGSYAFEECTSLTRVVYCGTPEQWNAIEISEGNSYFTGATVQFHNYQDDFCTICGAYVWEYSISNGEVTITGYFGNETNLVIPGTIENLPVTAIGWYAFYNSTGLTQVSIPNTVTEIGMYAFSGCTGLTTITIHDNVTTIGGQAFDGCAIKKLIVAEGSRNITPTMIICKDTLEEIVIPNSVIYIDERELQNSPNLTTVTFANNSQLTTLGYGTFNGCAKLTNVNFGENSRLTTIEGYAFRYCTNLQSIVIPDTVTGIGTYAFAGCIRLAEIVIPDGVSTIEPYVFNNCKNLVRVHLGTGTVDIKAAAFKNCSNLPSITIPGTVTAIGGLAFEGCSALENVYFDENIQITQIATGLFKNCSSLSGIAIPDKVKSIDTSAFEGCSVLANVSFGENTQITTIGEYAFDHCTSLAAVTIPEGVRIGRYAFRNCSSLTSVASPNAYLSEGVFSGCGSLQSITFAYDTGETFGYFFGTENYSGGRATEQTYYDSYWEKFTTKVYYIPATLTSVTVIGGEIPEYAFENCTNLTDVRISCPDTVLNAYAFRNCMSLESVIIEDGVTAIDGHAFYNCTSMTSIIIPDTVAWIWVEAFYNCIGLTNITIPYSVTEIGDHAFSNCINLTSVTIPDSVTSIGLGIFGGCRKLVSVTIPFVGDSEHSSGDKYPLGYIFGGSAYDNGMVPIQQNYYRYDSITDWTYYFPATLKTVTVTGGDIPAYAFHNCTFLTSINLKDNVTGIGQYAFYKCAGLTEITIPDKVTGIGYYAFRGCTNLSDVFFGENSKLDNIDYGAFMGCAGITNIALPKGVIKIREYAFAGCANLSVVFFRGTEADHQIMRIDPHNDPLVSATWHYEVVDAEFADQKCYYCAKCDNYFLSDGSYAMATVVFKNWDGTLLETKQYKYKDIVGLAYTPVREHENPLVYQWVFAGWGEGSAICTGNAEYTAVYSEVYVDYTVVFKNWDGTVLSTKTYHYGDKVTAPSDPIKAADHTYTYAFAGWDKEVEACTGDATYTATYTSSYIDYTVIFKDWDGTVLSTKTYHYGDKVTAPSDPSKAADHTYTYAFTGWDSEVVNCAGNATYTATYASSYIDYTVIFKDWDGTVLSTKTYHYGDKVTAPSNPTKAADNTYTYTFAGWDKAVVNCEGDATYTATYESTYIDYTVVFKDWDGTVLSSETYHWGDEVTAPADPTRAADNTYTYAFDGWDKVVGKCAGNKIYTATYKSTYIDYTVTFQNWDGTVLSTKTYHYGDKVTAPSNPTKAADNTYTYTFAGWDKPVVNCAGDVTYTATYKAAYIDYVVKFLNEDGTVLSTKTYHWGDVVTTPANPTKAADRTYTYAFAGWDKTVVNCAGNATYKATYSATYINYTVVFKNWDGTVLSSKTYHYGDAVSAPGAPTRPKDDKYAYTFVGWDKTVVNCAGDATYTAVYSAVTLVPNTITSSTHTVRDGIISKITVGTITDQLINALNEKSYAKVFSGTTEVPGSALVGTGMEVRIMDGDTVTVSATAVVTGDINGDGKITVTDFVQMKAHLLKKSTLQGASAHAADTNGDGNISVTDFVQMKAHLLGKNPVQPQSVPAATPVSVALSVSQNDASEQEPVAAVSYTHIVALVPDKKTLITV